MLKTEGFNARRVSQVRSATSLAAGEQMAGTAPTLQQQVYAYIDSCDLGGATDEETAFHLWESSPTNRRVRRTTIAARRKELQDLDLVTDSGKRRKTESGRQAVVWITTANAQPQRELPL